MYKVTVNENKPLEINFDKENVLVNGENVALDECNVGENRFHVLHKNASYNVEVVEVNHAEKTATVKVNNTLYNIGVKDQYDELLHRLGMDNLAVAKINVIKAPMPGLVLKVMVEVGQTIAKGDPLLVLEAMKMENVLKAPTDCVIKSIKAIPGEKVEKNEVLINID